jgi:DNA-binding transcriptional LysR family regulator
MDPFDGLDVFARVVEAESFTRAAAALGVSKSRVSERVAALERRLGARLLDRTTRKLKPTEAGRVFYARAREARAAAEAALAEVQALQTEPAGLLRIAALEVFTGLHLVPAVPSFLAANPLMRIEFVESAAVQDLVAEGLDLAIRVAAEPGPTTVVRRIGTSEPIVVASPAYLAAHGAPAHPAEIARHRTVGFAPLFWGREWRFTGPEGPLTIPVTPALVTSSTETLRAGALAGVGLTVIPRWAVTDVLETGALVRVLEDFPTPTSGLYAVYPSNRLIAPKVRRYVEHVVERMKGAGIG